MMEQSPEMIGGSGRQTHLMRSFVSRHSHLLGFSLFAYFLYICYIYMPLLEACFSFSRCIHHKSILDLIPLLISEITCSTVVIPCINSAWVLDQ